MSRNPKKDYTKYVHSFVDAAGRTRYAVAEWSEKEGQYQRPLDQRSKEITGCHTETVKKVEGFGGYLKRSQALRRARYLFGDDTESD